MLPKGVGTIREFPLQTINKVSTGLETLLKALDKIGLRVFTGIQSNHYPFVPLKVVRKNKK